MAERYEALLRAFNDPIPFTRRLARRLRAEPYRFEDVLPAPLDARDKVGSIGFDFLTQSALTAYGGAFAVRRISRPPTILADQGPALPPIEPCPG